LLALLAAMPVLLIAPVHYRGLVRQVRGTLPQAPTAPWRLGHAWYALAGLLLIGALAGYFCAYASFEAVFGPSFYAGRGSDEHALGRALIWHTGLFALLAIPLLRGVNFRALLLGTWSWRRSILTGIGCALLARIVLVLGSGFVQTLRRPAALASDLVRGLNGIHADYGTWAVLLLAAIASPILEEFVFRGVLLTAFRRHVSFWTAALGQAIAFAALHEEMSFMPFFIAFGLLAALLCRRSQGLLAPIVMHVSFNLFAVTTILATTHAFDGTI
jgi:membrane protease YdiL (CAAX protease family)